MTKNQILASVVSSLTQAMETAPTPDADEMLTVKEACRLLKVSRWTISRMCKRGQIRYIKLSSAKSGTVRIFRHSLVEYLTKLCAEGKVCAQQS